MSDAMSAALAEIQQLHDALDAQRDELRRYKAALALLADAQNIRETAASCGQFGSAGAGIALGMVQKMAARVLAGGEAEERKDGTR